MRQETTTHTLYEFNESGNVGMSKRGKQLPGGKIRYVNHCVATYEESES